MDIVGKYIFAPLFPWAFGPFQPFKVFDYGLTGLWLFLDSIVYWLVGTLFTVYTAIAGADLISSDIYSAIARKIEVVIGIFVLFYLAYILLKTIVNPDELNKKTSELVKHFIISLVLINIVPVIFTYAFKLQNIIISEDKIGVLLLGDDNVKNSVESIGNTAALFMLESFLHVPGGVESSAFGTGGSTILWQELEEVIESGHSWAFMTITQWIEPIHENYCITDSECVTYVPILSTICGIFTAYVLISFCIDIGIRVFKLALYQIISPIPILMYMLPSKKSVLENWAKKTLAVYLEVFIRIFVMYLVMFFIDVLINAYNDGAILFNDTTGDIGVIAMLIIILGLVAFLKMAPKLISEVIGFDSGNIKLGIRDKLATGGGLILGAGLGGGATALIRNGAHGISKWKETEGQNFGTRAKAFGNIFKSAGAGFASGALRSGYAARSAKNYGDVKNAASTGAKNATKARDQREAYRASHGGLAGSINGRFTDMLDSAKEWAGFAANTEELKKELDIYTKGADFKKQLEDLALKKSTKAKLYEQQVDALNQEAINRDDFVRKESENLKYSDFINREDVRNKFDINSFRREAEQKLNRNNYRSDAEYNEALDRAAINARDTALQQEYNQEIMRKAQARYSEAIQQRADQIEQLKRAKNFEVAKVVNEKLRNIDDDKNIEFKEIVNSFETFKKQYASMEGIADLKNLDATGWDASWDDLDGMQLTKEDFDSMKEKIAYTSNHETLDAKKKDTAAKYAKRIQEEQEKK